MSNKETNNCSNKDLITKIKDILNLWEKNPQLWFNSTNDIDKKVKELFGPFDDLMQLCYSTLTTVTNISDFIDNSNHNINITKNPDDKYMIINQSNDEQIENSVYYTIYYIIIYDQFVKHYYRNASDLFIETERNKVSFESFIQLCLENCLETIDDFFNISKENPEVSKKMLNALYNVSPILFTFFLMPLRHSNDPERIKLILPLVLKHPYWGSKCSKGIHLIRFYKATVKQFSKIDRFGLIEINNCDPFGKHIGKEYPYDNDKDIELIFKLNNYEQFKEFENILEYSGNSGNFDIKFDITNFIDEITKFLKKYTNIYNSYNNYNNYNNFNNDYEMYKPFKIIVSLSGGIDSNVLLFLMCTWLKEYNKTLILGINRRIEIEAVHINYNNRPTCQQELEFLRKYTSRLGVRFYIRTIDEINKSVIETIPSLRSFYEELTRIIRFNTYFFLVNNYNHNNHNHNNNHLVLLGHHAGDSLENLYTNIMTGKNFKNLLGMEPFYQEPIHFKNDDNYHINVGRPLLPFTKETLIKFAHEYRIPYLVDSTSDSCNRGRLRDQLIPFMDSFDERINPGMKELSEKITRMNGIVEQFVWKPFMESVTFEKEMVFFYEKVSNNSNESSGSSGSLELSNFGIEFWHPFFIKVARHFNVKYPRKKSVLNALNMWKTFKKIELTKELRIIRIVRISNLSKLSNLTIPKNSNFIKIIKKL